MRSAFLAAAVIAATAVAGCGGGSGDSNKTLSYSGFGAAANKLCKSINADIDPVSNKLTGEAKADAPVYDELIPKLRSASERFAALKPPAKLKTDFDKFNALTTAQVTGAEKAQAAAKTGNTTKYRAVLQTLQGPGKQTDLEASKLGAIECTK
jgi:hypothetical protein